MAAAASVSPSFHPSDSGVLLSYEETAESFVSHLRSDLSMAEIPTISLMDEPAPERRRWLIQQSRFWIVFISVGYGKSKRHMDELVKIIAQNETTKGCVLVVFYHVKTDDVEKLEGKFGEAFKQLTGEFLDADGEFLDTNDFLNEDDEFLDANEFLTPWEEALHKAGFLTGRVVSPEQHASHRVARIVDDVLRWRTHLHIPNSKGDFEIDRRMKSLEALVLLHDDGDGVNGNIFGVGVCGMGGDGKSTVMRYVLSHIQGQFDGCCLIEDRGNEAINGELLRLNDTLCRENNKVLIALDGVDVSQQVEHLLNRCGWIGCGSRIIVTTRNEDAIDVVALGRTDHKIHWRPYHKVEGFSDVEAYNFLVKIAFGGSVLPDDLNQVLKKVISYAQGNPFALRALCRGGLIGNTGARVWRSMVEKLDRVANLDIQAKMKTSYDALPEEQQDMFLDIACFFEGERVDYTVELLEACYPYCDVRDELGYLRKKSLISTDGDVIGIHSLHRAMAKEIVRVEVGSPGGDARQARMLWNHDDVRRVLSNGTTVSKTIRGVNLDICKARRMGLPRDALAGMSNLKFLKFHVPSSCSAPCGEHQHYKVYPSQASICLPDKLMVLHWHRYPLASLHPQFNPRNLVDIHLVRSNLERLWEGRQKLTRLKRINLSHSERLVEMPDLSHAPEMETITLVGCVSLPRLHSSITGLNKLMVLNLKNCVTVDKLPSLAALGCLETLVLAGCSRLNQLPEMPSNLKKLSVDEEWRSCLLNAKQ